MPHIHKYLPEGKRLIEPFVGSGAVFLNTQYPNYLLSDINPDLIDLYQILQKEGPSFIADAKKFFTGAYNTAEAFYELRETFNSTRSKRKKALIFLYLNRHCYNGLCRYNSTGAFNVPFGRYKSPYFPEREMLFFFEKSKNATFVCDSFNNTMAAAKKGDIVYCDPPYVPLSLTANFTNYSGKHFAWPQQEELAKLAKKIASKGGHVLISNHDTPLSRKLYSTASIAPLSVKRTISCRITERSFAPEILALFN